MAHLDPISCPRCRRLFGGEQALAKACPKRGGCRGARELRRLGMRRDLDEVWHLPATTDPGQKRLPLWGRGRPRKIVPSYFFYRTLGGTTCRVRLTRHARHTTVELVDRVVEEVAA